MDKDYCVTGITGEKFLDLFPNAIIRGKSFEVFDIEGTEFAIARKERKNAYGHNGFEISTDNVTIEEDLSRRDITINSMAIPVLTNELIDPFGGKNDIKDGIIRATTKAFSEDPLRVYRAARFACIYNFKIEENTIRLMNKLKNELQTLSAERMFVELRKALSAKNPSIFFESLKKANVLQVHFKEIYDLIGSLQPEKYHPEGDSYVHTMISVDNAAKLTNNLEIRFATLVHDLGKGVTPKSEYPHHYGHDVKGMDLVRNLCNRLKTPTSYTKCGITAAKEHMIGGIFYKLKTSKKVDFIERVNKSILGLEGLAIVVKSDRAREGNIDTEEVLFLDIGKSMLEEVTARKIGEIYNILPSIELGKKLHEERVKWMKKRGF